ncbi:hypothetical protein B7P43_G18164 [Cryptotermes secundus]|uniref:Uncharacterized protein n=1 Tax=Cryptotermes secundus TaxID=105785 RepID=A0A2J7PB81_9NEOP|nr:hypothetical protein B7P43_G18164 [Cryptotermes secundus]
MLHHDNAPALTSLFIPEFLAKHETTLFSQTPYSPDFVTAEFFMRTNKESLAVRRHSLEEMSADGGDDEVNRLTLSHASSLRAHELVALFAGGNV